MADRYCLCKTGQEKMGVTTVRSRDGHAAHRPVISGPPPARKSRSRGILCGAGRAVGRPGPYARSCGRHPSSGRVPPVTFGEVNGDASRYNALRSSPAPWQRCSCPPSGAGPHCGARHHRRRPAVLVVPTRRRPGAARPSSRRYMVAQRDRPLRAGASSRAEELTPAARGRPAHADPPGDVRPARPAADAGGGRGVRRRRVARRLREAHRPAAGQPALRRALRAPLARPRPLRRVATASSRTPTGRTPGRTGTGSSRALNADKPYDQFVREQLAGDELRAGLARRPRRDRVPAARASTSTTRRTPRSSGRSTSTT